MMYYFLIYCWIMITNILKHYVDWCYFFLKCLMEFTSRPSRSGVFLVYEMGKILVMNSTSQRAQKETPDYFIFRSFGNFQVFFFSKTIPILSTLQNLLAYIIHNVFYHFIVCSICNVCSDIPSYFLVFFSSICAFSVITLARNYKFNLFKETIFWLC